MASGSLRILLWILIIALILVFAIEDVQGRRGGGGGRGRGRSGSRSWSRSRSRSRVRSYRNVVLSGRIKGSSPFTSSRAFQAALVAGTIYGSSRYLSRYRHSHYHNKVPPICTNTRDRDLEGRVYGYFICPRETESVDKIYCCGPEKREYCCNKDQAQRYYAEHYNRRKGGVSVGVIIGIIVAIIVVCVLIFVCCKKRKHAGEIIHRMSSKEGRKREEENGHQAVPLNSPDKLHDDHAMRPPPPTYSASTAGYGGAGDVPYGPPQPQPEFSDSKSGLPPPGVDAGAPYPPPINPGGAPYPPPGGAPYPMPGAAPGAAPYPVPDGAPYPPPGGPYPTGAPPYPLGPTGSAAFDSSARYPPYPPTGHSNI